MASFDLSIVSPEKEIFSERALRLKACSVQGELEILPGHTELLAQLAPGPLWITNLEQKMHPLVIFGGILEALQHSVIILADCILRVEDLDKARALQAKLDAEQILRNPSNYKQHAIARDEIAFASAQLKIISYLSGKKNTNN
jgi:F-type H+-transporting ATPase subunit epsilon